MPEQKLLRRPVCGRGVVVQVDGVGGVGLDEGLEGAGGGEGAGDAGGDGAAEEGRVAGWGAVAAAEDEVLVCGGGGRELVWVFGGAGRGGTYRRRGPGRGR